MEELRNSITRWQANVTRDSPEEKLVLAAHRYDLIFRVYRPALELLCNEKERDTSVNQRRLRRALQTFLLWGQQYKVPIGELDRLIDRSWRLRQCVLRALTSIGQALTDRLIPRIQQPLSELLQNHVSMLQKAREEATFFLAGKMEHDQVGDKSSDDDSDTSSVFEADSLSEITKDMASYVDNLMDFDALYDAAQEDVSLHELEPVAKVAATANSMVPSSAAEVYTEMMRMRFPDINKDLLVYLGQENYIRIVKGLQQRKKNEGQAEDDPGTKEHDAATVKESQFHYPAVSKYYKLSRRSRHDLAFDVKVPPLPEEGKLGQPFLCIACGKKVTICSTRAWKNHLFSDLEAYICLDISCQSTVGPLDGREHWIKHLAEHYGDQWESFYCPLCLRETGRGESTVIDHLEKHLQGIALAALPNDWGDRSEPVSDVEDDDDDDDDDDYYYDPLMSMFFKRYLPGDAGAKNPMESKKLAKSAEQPQAPHGAASRSGPT
ncbi:hypothetical protein O1611_g639 [Lasiodiplodia mahajangana]|uniref:Uncharacterized protein n=1 Tax=Lasiodiplodia mahajangana TaxID=1108764 RepID=A0ACC2JZT0_9PEZI|nr:hypothetical protein O1611_g639 [Lasiodiplodia mahajangana]